MGGLFSSSAVKAGVAKPVEAATPPPEAGRGAGISKRKDVDTSRSINRKRRRGRGSLISGNERGIGTSDKLG